MHGFIMHGNIASYPGFPQHIPRRSGYVLRKAWVQGYGNMHKAIIYFFMGD